MTRAEGFHEHGPKSRGSSGLSSRRGDACWKAATIEDLRDRETQGQKPPLARFINAYRSTVPKASQSDPYVYSELLQVAGLPKPADALLSAKIVTRSLGAALLRALRI